MIRVALPVASEEGTSSVVAMVQERRVYRAMARDPDGKPRVGRSKSSLGVVVAGDPAAVGDPDVTPVNGQAGPNGEGMSVAVDSPLNLPKHRRPAQFAQGTGRHPVFALPVQAVPASLDLHQDSPTHAVVQSATWVPLLGYEAALATTRTDWTESPR